LLVYYIFQQKYLIETCEICGLYSAAKEVYCWNWSLPFRIFSRSLRCQMFKSPDIRCSHVICTLFITAGLWFKEFKYQREVQQITQNVSLILMVNVPTGRPNLGSRLHFSHSRRGGGRPRSLRGHVVALGGDVLRNNILKRRYQILNPFIRYHLKIKFSLNYIKKSSQNHTANTRRLFLKKSANSLQGINFICLWEPYKLYRCAQCRVANSETLWCIE
jgi:hypothetical protein